MTIPEIRVAGPMLVNLGPPALPPALEDHVTTIWDKALTSARSQGRHLFDGPIFSLDSVADDRVNLVSLTYRYLVAGRQDPAIAKALNLRPIGVTGLVACPEGLILGQRATSMAYDTSIWEPVPAGTLDQIPAIGCLLGELDEEIGLLPQDIDYLSYAGMTTAQSPEACDFIYVIRTPLAYGEIDSRFQALSKKEHSQLRLGRWWDLAGLVQSPGGDWLPALPEMIRLGARVDDKIAEALDKTDCA